MVVSDKALYYEFGSCRLDIENRQLINNGETVFLAQKTFEILCFFVQNAGKVLRKEELLDKFWEEEYFEETNLAQQIYRIRKAIKDKSTGETYVDTIRKYGYRFTAEVREVYDYADESNSLNKIAYAETNDFPLKDISSEYLNGSSNKFQQYPDKINKHLPHEKTEKKNAFLDNKNWGFIACGLLIVSLISYFYFSSNNDDETFSNIDSMAILPFKQIGEKSDEKIGLGLADTLISRFSNQTEITVIPTITIAKYLSENNGNPLEIGQKLGVDAVLTGTIQKNKGATRINVQLISVAEKTPVWTSKIDTELSDIFSLQDSIAEQITKKLPLLLVNYPKDFAEKKYTKNHEAFIAYSTGLSFWGMHAPIGFTKAIKEFEKAIEKDSEFPLAYAYMADSYAHLIIAADSMGKKDEVVEKGTKAANKALELDPNCAEAMSALALIYANTNKQKKAFELMEKSIKLKPNDSHARHRISRMYANKGQIEKAVEEMKIAQSLDPQSTHMNLFLARILMFADKPDEAIPYINKADKIEPMSNASEWLLIEVYEQKGQLDKAEKELKKLSEFSDIKTPLSRIYAQNGKRDLAIELLNEVLEKRGGDYLNYEVILAYLALGNEEKAIKGLERLIPKIGDELYLIKYDFALDPIRNNPRFIELLEKEEKKQNW